MTEASPRQPNLRAITGLGLACLLAALAVGLLLRLWRLPEQVMGGDEMHAVRVMLEMPLGEILVTYMANDNCIPLTAFYWLLTNGAGIEVSEMHLRLPVIAAGVLFLLLVPWAADRWLGRRAALVAAGLVAVYPSFVFYSRFARSYMPMLLFAFAATAAFFAWWRSGRLRWAAVYAICAPLALWLHLGAGPLLATPFAWAAAVKLLPVGDRVRGTSPPGWGRIVATGLAASAGVAAFLLPARHSLVELMETKRIDQRLPASEIFEVLELQAGTAWAPLTLLFWALAAVGFVALWRRRRDLAVYTATLVVGHAVGLVVLSPYGLHHPLVINRYLLPATPFVLLWVVAGVGVSLGALAARWPRRGRVVGGVAVVGWLVAVVLTGPFVEPSFTVGSFAHHNDAIWFTRPPNFVGGEGVPAVYDWLRDEAPPGPVLEYPWFSYWSYNRTFALYQLEHRRDVVVAVIQNAFWDDRLGFRNMSGMRPEQLLESRARLLLLHKDMAAEEDRVVIPEPGARRTKLPARARRILAGRDHFPETLEERWGPPIYSDALVDVWDLEVVRSGVR